MFTCCQSTATINNLLRRGQTVNTRTSICSKSGLFTTPFTHLCSCRGGSDVFRESDKAYFSPTLSCCFPGSFVWLRGLGLSVLRGTRGTFEPRELVNTPAPIHRRLPYLFASLCVCVCVRHLVFWIEAIHPPQWIHVRFTKLHELLNATIY